MAPSGEYEYEL